MGATRQTITSIEVGRYTALPAPGVQDRPLFLALTIEEVFDFSELEGEVRHGRV